MAGSVGWLKVLGIAKKALLFIPNVANNYRMLKENKRRRIKINQKVKKDLKVLKQPPIPYMFKTF